MPVSSPTAVEKDFAKPVLKQKPVEAGLFDDKYGSEEIDLNEGQEADNDDYSDDQFEEEPEMAETYQ